MTGAESILQTAAAAGVKICFANPGTTELDFVGALDKVPQIRPVLGLFEGVCTGAADGYGRITEKPALTLLHLGPGFANGIANLHNARRGRTPILNLIGEHTTWLRPHDPHLNMDIASLAGTVSDWHREISAAETASSDTAEALAASLYGQVATLIVPADHQSAAPPTETISQVNFSFQPPDEDVLAHAVTMIGETKRPALILGHRALRREGLAAAAQIQAKTDCALLMTTFPAYFDAGAGLPILQRIPYFPGQARKLLAKYDAFILAGAAEPSAFFGYAGGITSYLPDKAPCLRLDTRKQNTAVVLEELSSLLGPDVGPAELRRLLSQCAVPDLPAGPLNARNMCQAIAALQPEGCIVVEEGISSGASSYDYVPCLKPYCQLTLTGGAIGMGMPLALGAALAAPDRRVIDIQADGSAMYTLQALWSQAREKTNVVTVICSNRKYFTIELESLRAGNTAPGKAAKSLLTLDQPALDWVNLSRGMGVPATSVNTTEAFIRAFRAALAEPGPYLIEVVLE